MSWLSPYSIFGHVLGWLLIVAATARASFAWGAGVALGILVLLAVFRLVVPYGAFFSDPAALMIALRANRPATRW